MDDKINFDNWKGVHGKKIDNVKKKTNKKLTAHLKQ